MGEDPAPRNDGRPVAVVHLPSGEALQCVVGRRHRAANGSWWYELATAEPQPNAAESPESEGWPPLARGWRAGSHHYANGENWTLHRGGCWLPGERKLTLAQAHALMALPLSEGCTVCHAEDGLRAAGGYAIGDTPPAVE
ncbi:DUF6233 domain-containing protein [Streptomyces sp. H10-C2]|uniref:DUF6233 domain-containing protein n=1 Tax=unclassified Streptomyces TaxID=2593676 RepID=UPI0024B99785|nr:MULTISPECIES: DUF6233 domain-containing protein [unclassified Streptomyces]MDJ0345523.1 DUF6233 domain-containing protein [Streptomyces sp. PH10-H1]MDJ0374469.1 DUF6233 domain-containing protein [Streptomyces sp. H10-C2]